MSSLSPAAETLKNNDVLWLCVSESDCQSQISVGCRRSGNIRNLSAVRVCLWKGCDVFVAEKKSCPVLFPHFLLLSLFSKEEKEVRKVNAVCFLIGQLGCQSCDWFVTAVFRPHQSSFITSVGFVIGWISCQSALFSPLIGRLSVFCPLSVTGHVFGRRVAQLKDFIYWFMFEFRGDTFVTQRHIFLLPLSICPLSSIIHPP